MQDHTGIYIYEGPKVARNPKRVSRTLAWRPIAKVQGNHVTIVRKAKRTRKAKS